MKKTGIIAISLLLLICTFFSGCGGYKLEGGQPDGKIVSNNGIAVAQGDYIYYINGSMPSMLNDALSGSDQAAIFRMKADGTDIQRLSTKKAYALYVVGESIYFVSPISAERLCLFQVSINGGSENSIIEFEAGGEYAFSDYGMAAEINKSIVVYSFKTKKKNTVKDTGDIAQMYGDEKLYYYVGNRAGIKAISWEGGEPETVIEDRNGRIMGVDSSNLYYLRNEGNYPKLTAYNFEYKTNKTLSNSEYDTMLLSIPNKLMVAYSSEKSTLYYMHLDGQSKRTSILEGTVDTYAIGDKSIFYCNNSEGAIYSMDFDGGNKQKLADIRGLKGPGTTDPNYYLDVVGDKLFMFDSAETRAIHMIHLADGKVVNLTNEK